MSRDPDGPGPGRAWFAQETGSSLHTAHLSAVDHDALYQRAIEATSECILVIDERNRVVFANSAVETVFGYEPTEIVGESLLTLFPEFLRTDQFESLAEFVETGDGGGDPDPMELAGRHRSGDEVQLTATFNAFTYAGTTFVTGIVREAARRFGRRERKPTEKAFVESILDALPDVLYAFDTSGQFLRWNQRVNEVTGYSDEEIAELDPLDFVPEEDHDRIARSIARVTREGATETVESAVVTKDGREIPYELTGAPLYDDGEIIGETGIGRDITARKRHESRLQRVNELNTVIRSVDRVLIDASTREEIERKVCDKLVTNGPYAGAFIGHFEGPVERFVLDTSVDVESSWFDAVLPDDDPGSSPIDRARDSRSVEVVTDPCHRETDRRDRTGPERGSPAAAVIPVGTGERTFGVLCLFSERSDSFHHDERAILHELGQGIGNAIQSALTHELLYADTVTEIELCTEGTDVPFNVLSDVLDCRIELVRSVVFGDDLVFYVTVVGTTPAAVCDRGSNHSAFQAVEHIGTNDEEHRFEFSTDEHTIASLASSFGARVTDAVSDRGEAKITVELSPDENVPEFVATVQTAYPECELVARREVERSLQTSSEFRRSLSAALTEKQRAAMEAAYFSGYFEWPSRTCTAEDVASMLDIAPQTFHQHLRVAMQKLLTALLDESSNTLVE